MVVFARTNHKKGERIRLAVNNKLIQELKLMYKQEKLLYHQIHPIKLLTDWSTGIIALYLLWLHNITMALLVAFAPSIIISFAIIRFVDLEKYKHSPILVSWNYISN